MIGDPFLKILRTSLLMHVLRLPMKARERALEAPIVVELEVADMPTANALA